MGGMIRNTFETVPDAPVSRFVLEVRGGKKSLLVNSTDICQGTHRATVDFHAHNGKLDDFNPALGAKCGKARKKGHGKRVDARFDRVDAGFDRVDAGFDRVDTRFGQVDARFEQVDARFDQINGRFDAMQRTMIQLGGVTIAALLGLIATQL